MPELILPGAAETLPIFCFEPGPGSAVLAWPSANTGWFVRVQRMAAPHLVTGVRVAIGTSSGNAKVGLYSGDGTTLTQVILSASTALTPTNNTQDIPFTAQYQANPSGVLDYWAFLAIDNTTATVVRGTLGGAAAFQVGWKMAGNVATQFTTPTTPQAISGLTGGSSGFTPILQLY